MEFNEVSVLFDEVCAFLVECGGVYANLDEHKKDEIFSQKMQESIFFCIAINQYLLYKNDDGEVEHFICYWNVNPEDIALLDKGELPAERINGSVLYIVEHGSKAGNKGMWKAIKELRRRSKGMQGLVYNHKGEGLRLFPSQKGDGYGR